MDLSATANRGVSVCSSVRTYYVQPLPLIAESLPADDMMVQGSMDAHGEKNNAGFHFIVL